MGDAMTPSAETITRTRSDIDAAQKLGLSWGQMRANVHSQADNLGADIAATITTANDSCDGQLEHLLKRAINMRERYAAFLDIWFTDAKAQDEAKP